MKDDFVLPQILDGSVVEYQINGSLPDGGICVKNSMEDKGVIFQSARRNVYYRMK
ncbi:MAG: hypothetical protein IPH04_22765 [Saprospirales bacterium]|nr:hypothetical protein [Saprospirales bacterium]MBK7338101.1 hypothetical protein [Saprospirales bacterium]